MLFQVQINLVESCHGSQNLQHWQFLQHYPRTTEFQKLQEWGPVINDLTSPTKDSVACLSVRTTGLKQGLNALKNLKGCLETIKLWMRLNYFCNIGQIYQNIQKCLKSYLWLNKEDYLLFLLWILEDAVLNQVVSGVGQQSCGHVDNKLSNLKLLHLNINQRSTN